MAVLSTSGPKGRWRGFLAPASALFLWSALGSLAAPRVATPMTPAAEYQVEAVFLFNFAQFVDWPDAAFREPTQPLVIGVVGDDPFGGYLDVLVKGERVGSRPLLVRRLKQDEDLAACHIVFICRSEARAVERILARLKGRGLLTVSDMDGFTRHGGIVAFTVQNGKVRFRINNEAARACGLVISSKLLRLATPGKD